MPARLSAFQLYLSPDPNALIWGLHTTDLGYTRIPPGHPYPPFAHPESYTLNQTSGRILDEFQLIYISRGRGDFWSEPSGDERVTAGRLCEHEARLARHGRRHPAGQCLEGRCLERVSAEDGRRLVEGPVAGGPAAP